MIPVRGRLEPGKWQIKFVQIHWICSDSADLEIKSLPFPQFNPEILLPLILNSFLADET